MAWSCAAVLLIAAAFHVYWALGGRIGHDAVIPHHAGRNGSPALRPTKAMTHGVAAALAAAALLVLVTAQAVPVPAHVELPRALLRTLLALLATAFLIRAFGGSRFTGFFKKVRGTRFARLDTWFFSPLCLVLGLALADLAWRP